MSFSLLFASTQIFGTAPPGVRNIWASLLTLNASLNFACVLICSSWIKSGVRESEISLFALACSWASIRILSASPCASMRFLSASPRAISAFLWASCLALFFLLFSDRHFLFCYLNSFNLFFDFRRQINIS